MCGLTDARLLCYGCSGDGKPDVRLLDFECSGREDQAQNPGFLNPDIPHPFGMASNKPLKCWHDAELFNNCSNRESWSLLQLMHSRPAPRAAAKPRCQAYASSWQVKL